MAAKDKNEIYEREEKKIKEKRNMLSGTSYSFIIKGPIFVRGLEELKEEGYNLIFPIGYDTSPGPEEMYVYSTGLTTISLVVNYETKHHEGKINFVEQVEKKTVNNIKQGLEKKLKNKLIDKSPLSELIEEAGEN